MASYDSLEMIPRERSGVLHIHLLDRCNLHCGHCYMHAAGNGSRSLPLATVLRCLDDTQRLGIRTVFFSGGEPFLYCALDSIFESLLKRPFRAVVCTNGTMIGAAEAARVKACGASAQVSIDGDERYHDSFRRTPGAFLSANRGIREFVRVGVPVAVVVTICQDNLTVLPWLADWAVANGVQRISVQPLQKVGRGAAIANKQLTEDQMCGLFLGLSDLGQAYRSQGLHFGLSYRARDYLLEHPCAAYVCNGEQCHRRVAKEIKTLVIREDGTVLPEIPTLDPRFAIGNANQAPLDELVKNYFRTGYSDFHDLCRTVFHEVMPAYRSPIIPWDEIVSERSWHFERHVDSQLCQLTGAAASPQI